LSKKKAKIGECVHCGKIRPLSKDHVPPKNLFTKPLPSNMIEIPSCSVCNENRSKDDEYFRLILTMREDLTEHEEVQDVFSKVERSFERPFHSGLKYSFLQTVRLAEVITDSGIYCGRVPLYQPDSKRINKVLIPIINGLFYQSKRKRIPDQYLKIWWHIERLSDIKNTDIRTKIINNLRSIPQIEIGNNIFAYRLHHANDDENVIIGIMIFYGRVPFLFATIPQEYGYLIQQKEL